MKKFFIGKKLGMTQVVNEDGCVVPVTVLKAEPCVVADKQEVNDGVGTVVLGAGAVKLSNLNKPRRGFFERKAIDPKRFLKGFRSDSAMQFEVGAVVGVDIFSVNDRVSVRSKSIGRGFTGTIKRHNFSRGPMGHGSKSHRIPGSIGAGTTPGRVYKGLRMAGHYGDEFVTVKNLLVVKVDVVNQLLFVRGSGSRQVWFC